MAISKCYSLDEIKDKSKWRHSQSNEYFVYFYLSLSRKIAENVDQVKNQVSIDLGTLKNMCLVAMPNSFNCFPSETYGDVYHKLITKTIKSNRHLRFLTICCKNPLAVTNFPWSEDIFEILKQTRKLSV